MLSESSVEEDDQDNDYLTNEQESQTRVRRERAGGARFCYVMGHTSEGLENVHINEGTCEKRF
jgi:hypothetical protein